MRIVPDSVELVTVPRSRPGLLMAGLAALLIAGCGSDGPEDGAIEVTAAFYPLQFAVERVGGTHVRVDNLTPPGAEPHDVELSARDVAGMLDADLVVYLEGFSPAIDDAAADAEGFDVTDAAGLVDGRADDGRDDGRDAADDHDDHDGGDDRDGDDHDHDHDRDGADPHFWLDPVRLADVGDAIAERLADIRPAAAGDFRANAAALRAELEALDAELATGLDDCAITDIVTSHSAFGYLAERYGFRQIGVTGLSPHEEPSPGRLAEVSELVRDRGVSTIYYETLVDPGVAETVAAETGVATAVLDPLEGLTADSAGDDYVAVMRANLDALRDGQGCA